MLLYLLTLAVFGILFHVSHKGTYLGERLIADIAITLIFIIFAIASLVLSAYGPMYMLIFALIIRTPFTIIKFKEWKHTKNDTNSLH